VNAIPIGGGQARFVISNGIHRAYRWALRGEEWIPALFVQGPGGRPDGQLADFTWELMGNPTAQVPLLTDFLRDDLTMVLRYREETNQMSLKWDYESRLAPALDPADIDR
jgi:hypothetical protein